MALAAAVKGGGEEFRYTSRLTAMEGDTPTVTTHTILWMNYLEASTYMVMLVGRRRSMIGGGGDNKYQGGGIFSLFIFDRPLCTHIVLIIWWRCSNSVTEATGILYFVP